MPVRSSRRPRDARTRSASSWSRPIRVVAAVTPWNFPVDIAGIPIVYGLAMGCAKPSNRPSRHRSAPICSPRSSAARASAGDAERRARPRRRIRRSSRIPTASVVFTGSSKTGEQVARDAALKNRVLELGGNGPQIVLADANLEKAADAAIVGCFYLAGQCCTAAERILVHESVTRPVRP